MQAYPAILPNVNAAELRPFPEPVWSYARRTRWAGPSNPRHQRGRWTRVRRGIEKRVDREDRWLAAFLLGQVNPQIDPLVGAVLAYTSTGTLPGWIGPIPGWVHEVRTRLERALALRPADWWAVRAPAPDAPPAKDRSTWWVPRRSWRIASRFTWAVKTLRRYLVAVHAETIRRAASRRQAILDALGRRRSDQSSDHPYPQRGEGQSTSGVASGDRSAELAPLLARLEQKYGLAADRDGM